MSSTFYYRIGNQVRGPVTSQKLRKMATEGLLSNSDDIQAVGQEKWHMAKNVKGLFPCVEKHSQPLRAKRRMKVLPLAIAGCVILIIILIAVTQGQRFTNDSRTRAIIGTWETDANLTRTLAENKSLDKEKLHSDSWLFGISLKNRATFSLGGRLDISMSDEITEFRYNVSTLKGSRLNS